MIQFRTSATIVTMMLALAGCKKAPDASGNGVASGEPVSGRAGDPARAKLSAYTAGYNKLLDTFGLPATAESYAKEEIATKSPDAPGRL